MAMIEQVDLLPYRLPLTRPWRSARGTLAERCGWLVRIAAAGQVGFGDCAPLPQAGTETAERAEAALGRWQAALVDGSAEDALERLADDPTPTPAARFATECALLDLLSRAQGLSLRDWLTRRALPRVPVNAMLGGLGQVAPAALEAAARAGFRVLKLKVGLAEADVELERLRVLTAALPPRTVLRLDANGAWGAREATRFIEAAAGLPVEAIEEPLRAPSLAELQALQARAPFPLALDESLLGTELGAALARDPQELPVRRLVLKPAAVGGLRATLALAERAIAAGREVVITSLVESAAGLWPTVQLAAALPGQPPHGLATASWLRRDLGPPPAAEGGRIALPPGPGSGFCPSRPLPEARPGERPR